MRRKPLGNILKPLLPALCAALVAGCGGGGGGSAPTGQIVSRGAVNVPVRIDFGQSAAARVESRTSERESFAAVELKESGAKYQGCVELNQWFRNNAASSSTQIPVYADIVAGAVGAGQSGAGLLDEGVAISYSGGNFSILPSPTMIASACGVMNRTTRTGAIQLLNVPSGANRMVEAYAYPGGAAATETWYVAAVETLEEGKFSDVEMNLKTTLAAAAILQWAKTNGTPLSDVPATIVSNIKSAVNERYPGSLSYSGGSPFSGYADFWKPIAQGTGTTYVDQVLIDAKLAQPAPAPGVVATAATNSVYLSGGQAQVTLTCATTGAVTQLDGRCRATDAWSAIAAGNTMLCTYTATGSYTPGCRANGTIVATASTPITVSALNQPPTATATANVTVGIMPLAVNFTATCADSDGTCASYSWNFGDGTPTSSLQNPSHTFAAAGTFTVTLTATDNSGAAVQKTLSIQVSAAAGNVASISAGGYHTCELLLNGTVKCWGQNTSGAVGDGTTTNRSAPAAVTGLTGVAAISSGGAHTCALLTGGTVKCWGENTTGQLGDGSTTNRNAPVAVTGLTGVAAIATGWGHTCAMITGGTVKCWGENTYGQLGDGTTISRLAPVAVTGATGVAAIATGWGHACAMLSGGTMKCWGYNATGALGDGSTTNRSTPVAVTSLTGVSAITTGWANTCALLTGGTVKCWGDNNYGQLGDGSTTNRAAPAAVTGLTGAASITSGGIFTCASLTGGGARCWGYNAQGQLGDGSTTNRNTAAAVSNLAGVAVLSSGYKHSCAVLTIGVAKCWGENTNGQLGDGTIIGKTAPTDVIGN